MSPQGGTGMTISEDIDDVTADITPFSLAFPQGNYNEGGFKICSKKKMAVLTVQTGFKLPFFEPSWNKTNGMVATGNSDPFYACSFNK